MASTIITADRDAVVTEIEIAASPERVFDALINREQVLQWGGGEAFEITHWEMDARRLAGRAASTEDARGKFELGGIQHWQSLTTTHRITGKGWSGAATFFRRWFLPRSRFPGSTGRTRRR